MFGMGKFDCNSARRRRERESLLPRRTMSAPIYSALCRGVRVHAAFAQFRNGSYSRTEWPDSAPEWSFSPRKSFTNCPRPRSPGEEFLTSSSFTYKLLISPTPFRPPNYPGGGGSGR